MLISKLVDTNLDGVPSENDTVVMGRWPTNLSPEATHFGDWGVTSHRVEKVTGVYSGNAVDTPSPVASVPRPAGARPRPRTGW